MPIFALRTTSNREDQVFDFVSSNVEKKNLAVLCLIRPHGLRGYIFIEVETREIAEEAYHKVPYARGILPKPVTYPEIEHMLEQIKVQMNIQKGDIVEIITDKNRKAPNPDWIEMVKTSMARSKIRNAMHKQKK